MTKYMRAARFGLSNRLPEYMMAGVVFCLASLVFPLVSAGSEAPRAQLRPNILLIVSDDQGYADVGFNGSKDIPTPHLDRLSREGLVFLNGYITASFCSPARAGLLTGRHQSRFGHENNPVYDPSNEREGLPLSERLLPELLRPAGYVTGWIGKWHLGAAPKFRPYNRGFDETFGFIGGGHHFIDWTEDSEVEYRVPITRNGERVEVEEHLTTVFGREAALFVRRHTDQPWFLFLAFNAPHLPHEPTPERLAEFEHIADPVRRAYAAQVSLMDDAIGETLEAVRDSGQEQRTFVFFFSDNGGPTTRNGSINEPLRGNKGDFYEGGVRVPFVASWPGTLPAGRNYEPAVSSVDVFATALALAGVPMPTDRLYDSVNLLPFLTGERSGPPHDLLFWRTSARGRWAVRQGNHKLVRESGRPDELYNLPADIGESDDLSSTQDDIVQHLGATLDAWDAELVDPAFEGENGRRYWEAKRKQSEAGTP